MTQAKITIIIPVYNAQDNLGKCLDSILDQTFQNFEIIALNDGSKDRSLEVLRTYEAKTDKLKVIDKPNEGVAKTRNRGIEEATADYIMFIDNDDFIDPDYLKTYYEEALASQADIVMGGYRRVNQDQKVLFQEQLADKPWSKYIVMAPWAKIYRRDFIRQEQLAFLDYPIGEDVYFNLIAYQASDRIRIIDNMGYNWYFNDRSISNTSQRGFNPAIDIREFLGKIVDHPKFQVTSYTKYFFKRYYIWYLLFSGRQASAEEFLREHRQITQWLEERDLRSSLSPFNRQVNADRLQTKLAVAVLSRLEKLGAMPLFAKLYCKKK